MSTRAPFHQTESSLNSNRPVNARMSAAGGRKGNASVRSPATSMRRVLLYAPPHPPCNRVLHETVAYARLDSGARRPQRAHGDLPVEHSLFLEPYPRAESGH